MESPRRDDKRVGGMKKQQSWVDEQPTKGVVCTKKETPRRKGENIADNEYFDEEKNTSERVQRRVCGRGVEEGKVERDQTPRGVFWGEDSASKEGVMKESAEKVVRERERRNKDRL